ncbi:hypothetical protein BLI708_03775 [Bifidobacterium imperatoris]|uniref:Uncharacterized protein n=1 Tax=Bifidobacterium imperatoris TaxID=2020965 RepID=A0A2N5IPQ0_9BIFI|nr:hypothetical protein [Bifidobacterium imperatoris]PLS23934.1 hypothetical protein Tam1G_2031 [Bifidobacterium imperatoris]QSY58408.1 hypothetical protein BLI708_03775 [Bifidobacterium imperatoris]
MYMHIGACITLAMPNGAHVRWLCKAVEAEKADGTCIDSRDDLVQLLREDTPQVKSIAFVPEDLIPLLRAALQGDDAAAEEYAGLTEDM